LATHIEVRLALVQFRVVLGGRVAYFAEATFAPWHQHGLI